MNKKIAFCFWLFAFGFMPAGAQRVLSLDSCRQMALRNNKQLGVSKLKQDVAEPSQVGAHEVPASCECHRQLPVHQ